MQRMSVTRGSAAGATEGARACPGQAAHHRQSILRGWAACTLLICSSMSVSLLEPAKAAALPANVDATRLGEADHEPGNWMTYGRTYGEQRFSPLSRITASNVKQLGLAWYADLDTNRGQEATPLVIDGVLYVSTAWSMVKAYNAKTGGLLWSYDPAVSRALVSEDAAMWSIEVSPLGKERYSSVRSTAGWSRSTREQESQSGVS